MNVIVLIKASTSNIFAKIKKYVPQFGI